MASEVSISGVQSFAPRVGPANLNGVQTGGMGGTLEGMFYPLRFAMYCFQHAHFAANAIHFYTICHILSHVVTFCNMCLTFRHDLSQLLPHSVMFCDES